MVIFQLHGTIQRRQVVEPTRPARQIVSFSAGKDPLPAITSISDFLYIDVIIHRLEWPLIALKLIFLYRNGYKGDVTILSDVLYVPIVIRLICIHIRQFIAICRPSWQMTLVQYQMLQWGHDFSVVDTTRMKSHPQWYRTSFNMAMTFQPWIRIIQIRGGNRK